MTSTEISVFCCATRMPCTGVVVCRGQSSLSDSLRLAILLRRFDSARRDLFLWPLKARRAIILRYMYSDAPTSNFANSTHHVSCGIVEATLKKIEP